MERGLQNPLQQLHLLSKFGKDVGIPLILLPNQFFILSVAILHLYLFVLYSAEAVPVAGLFFALSFIALKLPTCLTFFDLNPLEG